MPLEIGKKYRGKFSKRTLTITREEFPGKYACMYDRDHKVSWVTVSHVEEIPVEVDIDQEEESIMKIKIGDKITLKKWEDIDQENRRPVSDGVKIHPIKDHKRFYDQTTPIEVISLPGNKVVNIRLPLKNSHFSYWDILEKDIYEVLGDKPKSKFRVLRTSLPEVIESKAADEPLKEIEINLGETFLLKIDGGEAIKVCIERSDIHKDDTPRHHNRISISGVVIPQETVRKIRG